MLKTNSKAARQNIINYIRTESEDYLVSNCGHDPETLSSDPALCWVIYETFNDEILKHNNQYIAGRVSEYEMFKLWAQGLAMGGLFDYYLCKGIDTLGDILEETEEERNKYDELDAEDLLTRLIYREIIQQRDRCAM